MPCPFQGDKKGKENGMDNRMQGGIPAKHVLLLSTPQKGDKLYLYLVV